jgi:CBS domain-containing protein
MSIYVVGGETGAVSPIANVPFEVDAQMEGRLAEDAPFDAAWIHCRGGIHVCGDVCTMCSRFAGWRRAGGDRVTVSCRFTDQDPVSTRMTPAALLATISPRTLCRAADEIARARDVRHLLVVSDGRLHGVLCRCDLFPADDTPAVTRLAEDQFAIVADAPLGTALAAMRELGLGCLPVLAGDAVVGVLTRGDLRRTGVPEELLGAGRCCACGSTHGVRRAPAGDVDYCLDCLERASERDGDDEEIGAGD